MRRNIFDELFRRASEAGAEIVWEYNGRSKKPFTFVLYIPFKDQAVAVAHLDHVQAEKVLTKSRKYERISRIRNMRIWISKMIQKHHR